ncbi:hypothetical protein TYRP_022862, partial [Tyrophagus putrescentiae]
MMKSNRNSRNNSSSKLTSSSINPAKNCKNAKVSTATDRDEPVSTATANKSTAKVAVQDKPINGHMQPNRQKNLLTVHRKCLVDDCKLFFSANSRQAMLTHMAAAHGVRQFPCLVAYFAASFGHQTAIAVHLTNAHSTATVCDCPKCGKCSSTYRQMSQHDHLEHALGVFRCAFAGCSFEGSKRCEVACHFSNKHRKVHENVHLCAKPFKCQWDGCSYNATSKGRVVEHIRNNHLKLLKTQKLGNDDQQNPMQWIAIDQVLIKKTRE